MRLLINIFVVSLTLFSCKDRADKRVYKPDSSGNINSLLVVVEDDLWTTSVGDAIRSRIGAEVYGLPQIEPQFDLRQVPPPVFSDFVRMNRIVLKVQRSEESTVKFYTDPYATPQKMILVSGPSPQTMVELIEKNGFRILNEFKKVELKERQRRTKKSLFNTDAIESSLGVSIALSSVYRIAKNEENFFWVRRDTKTGIISLLIYSLPLQDFTSKEAFSQRVIQIRDSVAKQHIPGPIEGNYMTTELAYTPFSVLTETENSKV